MIVVTYLSKGYDWSVRCVLALEIATSVRNISELDRLSVLFLMSSTLPPLIVKTGSGLTLLGACELVESVRRVFLHRVDEQNFCLSLRMKERTSQNKCSRQGSR